MIKLRPIVQHSGKEFHRGVIDHPTELLWNLKTFIADSVWQAAVHSILTTPRDHGIRSNVSTAESVALTDEAHKKSGTP